MNKFKEQMKKAEENSKQNFLKFVKGIYDIDESLFEHLWKVPIISSYEDDTIISTELSTKDEDQILEILDEFIESELGDSEACFLPLSKLETEFSDEEIEEWRNKVSSGEISQVPNAVIVYNQTPLIRMYNSFLKDNEKEVKPKSIEEIDKIFTDYLSKIITHERCHLNANAQVIEYRNLEMESGIVKRNLEIVSEYINGAELTSWENDDLVKDNKARKVVLNDYQERNEVLIDTLAQMIEGYQEGDSIQDCLYRIIKKRSELGKSQYDDINDKEVLAMFALFPEELTEWATFGSYDSIRVNKLKEKIIQVLGDDIPLGNNMLTQKISKYCSNLQEGTLSEKQEEMLKLLGISTERKIGKKEIEEVAKSEKAMGQIEISVIDIKNILQALGKQNPTTER